MFTNQDFDIYEFSGSVVLNQKKEAAHWTASNLVFTNLIPDLFCF
jgi:hypothetical protein